MEVESFILISLIAVLGVLLVLGLPVGFALGGLAVLGTLYVWGPKGLLMISNTAYSEATSFILVAIPLFIFMANVLRNSGLADDLYEMIYKWFGKVPGGLAAGTVVICAVFAAMAGVSSVATVSMGLIALPSMLRRGYQKEMAVGCISAGGALGILIPPSIIMIIYGSMAEVSIGKLFMAGIVPGILLSSLFCLYILVRCFLNPALGPKVAEQFTIEQKIASTKGVILPVLLITVVLGCIYSGAATPTEAAGIGALGAVLCSLIYGRLTFKNIKDSLYSTMGLNAMVMWIMIGAVAFTHLLAYAGISEYVNELVLGLGLNRWVILMGMQLIFFILGMVLDPAGIIMLTTPIFIPLVHELGFDPVWFGILFTINMEMAYVTPPFGFNLFIMKAVAPPEVSMMDIYRSIVPYVLIQMLCLIMVMIWPDIAMYLPSQSN
ncbi:TRAP transporter large permease subunit [Desulfosarcina sp. OttesenSCG-928-A07]|nr:TRAP transporter large permease subunit [Desulfosarcina sp. OttesenSCG-928-G17]MDL2328969.1 TRAP transporter large permease subunit [Desulfosarcina sp. OttesenSCG-928-A07]